MVSSRIEGRKDWNLEVAAMAVVTDATSDDRSLHD